MPNQNKWGMHQKRTPTRLSQNNATYFLGPFPLPFLALPTSDVALPNTELTVTSLGREPKSTSIVVSLQETIAASTVVVVLFLPLPVVTVPVTEVPEPAA